MEETYTPADCLLIEDLEALKTIADPLRTQIMEALESQPLTVNQVAERLGLAASKLYYHISLLEKHRFVTVVSTTTHGNLIEKRYGVTARDFDLHENLLNFASQPSSDKSALYNLMLNLLDTARADLARSLEAREFNRQHGAQDHPRRVLLERGLRRIPDARAEDFMDRLAALFKEFEAEPDGSQQDTPLYALTIALHPSFYYHEDLDKSTAVPGRKPTARNKAREKKS